METKNPHTFSVNFLRSNGDFIVFIASDLSEEKELIEESISENKIDDSTQNEVKVTYEIFPVSDIPGRLRDTLALPNAFVALETQTTLVIVVPKKLAWSFRLNFSNGCGFEKNTFHGDFETKETMELAIDTVMKPLGRMALLGYPVSTYPKPMGATLHRAVYHVSALTRNSLNRNEMEYLKFLFFPEHFFPQ